MKLRVLRVLSCPTVYIDSQLEVHELWKMRRALKSMQMYAECRRYLKEGTTRCRVVQARANQRKAAELFLDWQQKAHYERSLRTIALPFFLTKQQFKLQYTFGALK